MARKDKCLIVNEDQTVELVNVQDVSSEAVLTERGQFYLDGVKKFLDIRHGYILYVANLDMPARIEAEKLRDMRRSTALKRMFEFNVSDKPDYFKYIPYVIIALLILFK